MSEQVQRSESGLRRRAARHGLRVVKLRENNRDWRSYGPYMLVDTSTNAVVAHSLDLSELIDEIDAR